MTPPPPPPASEHTPLLGHGGGATTPGREAEQAEQAEEEDDEEGREQEHQEEQTVLAKEVPLGRLALIMGAAWLGVFLGAVDSTVIATLSAPIASEFESLGLYSWLATAYLVANAACQPISGRLTDIFGRGPGLVASSLLFAAGNLVCGLAGGAGAMIAGRVVAGIGGGGLMSISTFVASDLVPLRRRGLVQGMGNVCYGSGAMLGGLFGGLVHDHTALGWRLAFLLQVPPTLLSAAAMALLIRLPPKQSRRSYLARIDFAGVLLAASFLVLLLLGLGAGGNLVPWTHPLVVGTLPLSLAAAAAFVWWESRARQPIIPVRLLLDRTLLAACSCNLLSSMVALAGIFYVPLYLQVSGDSPTGTGVKMLPSPVGVSVGSLGAGYLMKRTGRYVGLGVAALATLTLGVGLFTLQGRQSPLWLTAVAFFFVGGGYGAMLTVTLLACIAAVDHSQQAVITSATCEARPDMSLSPPPPFALATPEGPGVLRDPSRG